MKELNKKEKQFYDRWKEHRTPRSKHKLLGEVSWNQVLF